MLNKVCLQGRLTKDPEVRNTSNQTAVASFTIACNRQFKNEQGNYDADFINCVAWKGTATFVGQNFHKGDMIIISGRIQTRSYDDKNGNKVFVTEVIAEEVNFGGGSSKKESSSNQNESSNDMPFEV